MTAVANAAFTAAQFNAYIRDNLNETAPAKATTAGAIFAATGANSIAERIPSKATITTSQSTTSTTYTDLATVGPSVTCVTGPSALVLFAARAEHNTTGGIAIVSVEVSGATTLAANDDWAFNYEARAASSAQRQSSSELFTTLTPGSNTFTVKYRTASGTATYEDRRITVIPF
jgi:hypothetical protein